MLYILYMLYIYMYILKEDDGFDDFSFMLYVLRYFLHCFFYFQESQCAFYDGEVPWSTCYCLSVSEVCKLFFILEF